MCPGGLRMGVRYLSFGQICMINGLVTSSRGPSLNYRGGIDFVASYVGGVYGGAGGREALAGKCAYLWHAIASNQYFTNGNKRTGFVAADCFLRLNGARIEAAEGEKIAASARIAREALGVDELKAWVEARMRARLPAPGGGAEEAARGVIAENAGLLRRLGDEEDAAAARAARGGAGGAGGA